MNKSDLEKEYEAIVEEISKISEVEIDQEMLRRIRQVTPNYIAEQIISVSTKPSLAQDIAESKGEDDE